MGSLFELEVLPDGRRFYLLLAHDLPALGAGLRPGARVRLDNVHPLCLWGQVQVRPTPDLVEAMADEPSFQKPHTHAAKATIP